MNKLSLLNNILIAIFITFFSCKIDELPPEPDYNNPYDPKSPNFNEELDTGWWHLIDVEFIFPFQNISVVHKITIDTIYVNYKKIVKNKIYFYFVGGLDKNISSNQCHQIIVEKDSIYRFKSLTRLDWLLFNRNDFTSIIYENFIFAFGGDSSGTFEVYDLSKGKVIFWTYLPEPQFAFGMAAIKWKDNFLILGGRSKDGKTSKKIYLFEPSTYEWFHFADLPEALSFTTAQIVEDNLYVMGGFDSLGSPSSKIYRLFLNSRSKTFELLPLQLNSARGKLKSVVRNGSIYVFGGQDENGLYSQVVDEISLKEMKLFRRKDIPLLISTDFAFILDKEIYILGGSNFGLIILLKIEFLT